MHPKFIEGDFQNDIALLHIKKYLKLTRNSSFNDATNTKKKNNKNKKPKKEHPFPYYAAIAIKGKKPHCGGALISSKAVITAGLCFK